MKHGNMKKGALPKHWEPGAKGFVSSDGPAAAQGELRPQNDACHAKAAAMASRAVGKKK